MSFYCVRVEDSVAAVNHDSWPCVRGNLVKDPAKRRLSGRVQFAAAPLIIAEGQARLEDVPLVPLQFVPRQIKKREGVIGKIASCMASIARFVRGFFAYHTLGRRASANVKTLVEAFRQEPPNGQNLPAVQWPFVSEHLSAIEYALGFENTICLLGILRERLPALKNPIGKTVQYFVESYYGLDFGPFDRGLDEGEFSTLLQNFSRLYDVHAIPPSILSLMHADIVRAIMKESMPRNELPSGQTLLARLGYLGYPQELISETLSKNYDRLAEEFSSEKMKQFLLALLQKEVAERHDFAFSRLENFWLPLIETAIRFPFIPLREVGAFVDDFALRKDHFNVPREVQALFRGCSLLFSDNETKHLLEHYATVQVGVEGRDARVTELKRTLTGQIMYKVRALLGDAMRQKFSALVTGQLLYRIENRILNSMQYESLHEKMVSAARQRGKNVNALYDDLVTMVGQNNIVDVDRALWIVGEHPESFQAILGDAGLQQFGELLHTLRQQLVAGQGLRIDVWLD